MKIGFCMFLWTTNVTGEHEALLRAFSKGSWFNTRIKPRHDFALLFDASGRRQA